MSKIENELIKVTEVKRKEGESRQSFLAAIMKGISGLSDKEWEALSDGATEWYNANADARNAAKKEKKEPGPLNDFPDVETKEEETPSRRRRSSDDDGDKDEKKDKAEPRAMKKGDRVKVVTKRGKTIEGKIVELDKTSVVIKSGDGEEHELDLDRLESTEVFHGTAGDDEKSKKPPAPEKGDKVEIVTKRGKKITGKITEIDDKEVVLKDGEGEVHEFDRERIESITVIGGDSGGKDKADDEPKSRRRSGGDDDKAGEKKERAKNEKGVSIGQRIKELIAANLDSTEEEIGKLLKKEDINYNDNTLGINYSECHKFLKALRDAGVVKK